MRGCRVAKGVEDSLPFKLAGETILDGTSGMGVLPHHFASFITPAEANQDIAGCIILAAAPCTVVGVLVEVSVMLSVWAVCNRTRHWFPAEKSNIFQIPSA
jgi:hypothetical protein